MQGVLPFEPQWRLDMTVCPIAIAVGCKKCPIFAICPVKGVIGDYQKKDETPAKPAPDRAKSGGKRAK
jgi:hypothetical protein